MADLQAKQQSNSTAQDELAIPPVHIASHRHTVILYGVAW